MSELMTLAVDCGGGGIKGSVLDPRGTMVAKPLRVPTPYPLPPSLLVETVVGLSERLPAADRVTMGMPGMIRHGVVIATPHYITRSGPRSKVVPELVEEWKNFDMGRAIGRSLGLPTKVWNDAEVAGAGVITGTGLEMIITLGTGLGNAVFDAGALAPHVEVSQGFVRWGLTYDDYIGEHERLRLGDAHWSRRVRRIVDGLRPMYMWDRLYIGGGNSKRITAANRARLGDDVVIVPNDAGIIGGVRAWEK
ncbi:ROK family protein [Schaalia hyovaginalis]|uniref:ROK family protein n=1 Tax=Schaalia hyovaginalis TaxID=29316 RepID=UPI002A7FB34B|nr:ROK family protein [Schaalia hyovaginalis]MDY3664827.1 ROK family protein [Schaalia hyovaginalis]